MIEFTPDQIEPAARAEILYPALTVEVALYIMLAIAAFFARFFLLGGVPLNADEARQALAAWNFSRGIPDAFTGSPFLFAGDAALFALFGATDTAARFFPALAGVALVLTPALLRDYIGRAGALIASALFVFSPSLFLFSRETNGVVIAVACALAALAFAARYLDNRQPREAYWSAGSLALALLAAPEVWTFVVTVLVFLLIVRLRREPTSVDARDLPRAALVFVLIFVGVATVFMLHRDGLGAAFNLFGAWLDGLRPGGSPFDPLRLLVLYEPVIVFFGAAALIELAFSVREMEWRRTPVFAFALWATVAFILYTIGADKNPAHVVAIVVPLTLVAAWYIGAWLTRWIEAIQAAPDSRQTLLTQELPVLLLAGALAAFLYLVIAEFALRGGVAIADAIAADLGMAQSAAAGFDLAVIGALVLVAFVAVAFLAVTTLGIPRAQSVAIVFALVVLSAWTFRQSMMLNFTFAPDAQEWLTPTTAAPNLRNLISDIEDASRWRANDSHTLAIAVDPSLGAQLGWYLRDFRAASFVTSPSANAGVQAMLLPGDAPGPAGWVGQRYDLEFTRGSVPPTSLLRWLIFRDVGGVQSKVAVLWLPKPQ